MRRGGSRPMWLAIIAVMTIGLGEAVMAQEPSPDGSASGTQAAPAQSAAPVKTASPERSAGPEASGVIVDPGDPRSEGTGPGLTGDPLLVLLGVVLLGLVTAAVTVAASRLARAR